MNRYQHVVNIVHSILGGSGDVEDLAQEVFIMAGRHSVTGKVYHSLKHLTLRTSFSFWKFCWDLRSSRVS